MFIDKQMYKVIKMIENMLQNIMWKKKIVFRFWWWNFQIILFTLERFFKNNYLINMNEEWLIITL